SDRDAISSQLLRYRNGQGDDWADIIDMLTIASGGTAIGRAAARRDRRRGSPSGWDQPHNLAAVQVAGGPRLTERRHATHVIAKTTVDEIATIVSLDEIVAYSAVERDCGGGFGWRAGLMIHNLVWAKSTRQR
ncbi:MAG TPA: hypothetical protein VNG34_13090, partial [Actinomycetota bacterium]|nr:hypothetical protein [Actinomycetota bacterium]